MDTGNDQNTLPVILLTMPIDALLRESKRLQAISEQLIRQSRELRTICVLIERKYSHPYSHLEKGLQQISTITIKQE
jgi:hypothetical protein